MVGLVACTVGSNRGTARADGPSCPDGRGALGGNPGPLESRADGRLHGVNSLFSAEKRRARRYRAVEYMTAMLHFVAVKLTPPRY